MDHRFGPQVGPSPGNLAAARLHVQALSDGDREALLRALLEQYQDGGGAQSIGMSAGDSTAGSFH